MIGKLLEHARRKDAFRLGAWRECSGPVSGRSKEKQYKSLILFDSPLKIALREMCRNDG